MIIQGRHDLGPGRRNTGREMRDRIPGRLNSRSIEEAGHTPHLEQSSPSTRSRFHSCSPDADQFSYFEERRLNASQPI